MNNALLPKYGSNQIWFDYDNKGSLFGFYGYSFSDAFQIEIANLGRFKNNVLNTNTKYKTLTDVFAGKQNLNNRFGGKLLFLSPTKGAPFWLSSRITLGRDQESDQGYSFIELNSTKELNPTLALNINPKYVWSGHGNIGGIGLGINYKLNNKFQLIPEINFNIPDNAHNNNSIILRYLKNEKRAFDLYLSNAFGSQDIGQLIKSKDYKYGFKINLIF